MAVPIRTKPVTQESALEIRARLDQAEIKHAAAILEAYELLQDLHDRGVLGVCRGALSASDTIVTKLSVAANSPETIDSVRNAISLMKIFSSIDPEFLRRLADEISDRKKPPEHIGFWGFGKVLFGREGRRALAGAAAFVQAFGRALAKP